MNYQKVPLTIILASSWTLADPFIISIGKQIINVIICLLLGYLRSSEKAHKHTNGHEAQDNADKGMTVTKQGSITFKK